MPKSQRVSKVTKPRTGLPDHHPLVAEVSDLADRLGIRPQQPRPTRQQKQPKNKVAQ